MITAKIEESIWRHSLQMLPAWRPPLVQTVVLAPHPDDETLGCGGLISFLRSSGVKVTVIAVTDGEHAYNDGLDIREQREREQHAALACLGVEQASIHRLRITDSGVAAQEAKLAALLEPFLTAETHLIAPWQHDFHPDHEACGRAAREVSERTKSRLTSYFFWTWHRGTPQLLEGLDLVSCALSEKGQQAKHEALQCHRSQLEHVSGAPILPEPLLAPAYRPFEVYLPA